MQIEIINNNEKSLNKAIKKWIKAVKKELEKSSISITKTQLTVVFASPKEIQKLNHQFRKKNKPTDILSFSALESGSLGEIVLCPLLIKKKSLKANLPYLHYLLYLILHGLLHLLGFEHESDRASRRSMYNLQDKIFEKLIKSF